MVSLKHETGVVGFFWVFTHWVLGFIIADEAYKVNWSQDNSRAYGNIGFSMILGVVGFTLVTAVTVHSFFGIDYWMKLKPIIQPQYHQGVPSITFMSSMFPLVVLIVNLTISTFGTKKRAGGQKIWKHSATNAAHLEFKELLISLTVMDSTPSMF